MVCAFILLKYYITSRRFKCYFVVMMHTSYITKSQDEPRYLNLIPHLYLQTWFLSWGKISFLWVRYSPTHRNDIFLQQTTHQSAFLHSLVMCTRGHSHSLAPPKAYLILQETVECSQFISVLILVAIANVLTFRTQNCCFFLSLI